MSWINIDSQNGNRDSEKHYTFARWMSWLFLLVSILLLIYTYYRAEITFQGNQGAVYFKYYLISLFGILFWIFVLRLRTAVMANIVMTTMSLLVGLYLVEGVLIFLNSDRINSIDRVKLAAELEIEFDERTKKEVLEHLIANGVDAVPVVPPGTFIDINEKNFIDSISLFPLGGVSNKTTVMSNQETGKYPIYRSDRYGFNNPNSQWDLQKIEWLLIGDSFTQGENAQQGQDIAGQLRAINNSSAISLGMGSNGPLIEYATLVEYGRTLTPARVLWIYFEGNDLRYDLRKEKTNPFLMQYMNDGFSQNLINRQKEIDTMLEKYILEAKTNLQTQSLTNKTRWIKLQEIRDIIDFDEDRDLDVYAEGGVDVDDPLFAKILSDAKGIIESWGGELYFVYLTEYDRYNSKIISHDEFRKKAEVIDLVKQIDIPIIDIHEEVFAKHADPLAMFPFRMKGHYNEEGYREAAKAISKYVRIYEKSNK